MAAASGLESRERAPHRVRSPASSALLARCEPYLQRGEDVALVAHGHVLRILTATWLDLDARSGRLFELATGTVSLLGHEREQRTIELWNAPGLPPTHT